MIKRICCIISIVIILGIFLSPVINIRSYAEVTVPTRINTSFSYYTYSIIQFTNIGYMLLWSSNYVGSQFDYYSSSQPTRIYIKGIFKMYSTLDDALNGLYNGDNIGFTDYSNGNYYDISIYFNGMTFKQFYSNTDEEYAIVPIFGNNNSTSSSNGYAQMIIPGGYRFNRLDISYTSLISQGIYEYSSIPVYNQYKYEFNLHNCTSSISDGYLGKYQDIEVEFFPDNAFTFYGVSNVIQYSNSGFAGITVLKNPVAHGDSLKVRFNGIQNNTTITVNAVEYFPISYDLENITLSNETNYILKGQTYVTTVSFSDGYTITDSYISMDGIDITSQVWDPETNTINAVSVQGPLVIRIIAEIDEAGQLANIGLKLEQITTLIREVLGLQGQQNEKLDDIKDILDGSYPEEDNSDDQSRIQEEISNYDDLETSLSDQAASNVDEVMDTSIDEDVVQFMLDFQNGMSWLYDNELVIAGLGSCGVFMVIGFLIFGKKGHG